MMTKSFDFIHNLSGLFVAKNTNFEIISMTKTAANLFGWKNIDEGIGKLDYEIPCKVSEIADQFSETDKEVIRSREEVLSVDVVHYTNGFNIILGQKIPIKNDIGLVEGIFYTGINVTNISQFKPHLKLYERDKKVFGDIVEQKTYILGFPKNIISLTKQQELCLFLLMRGKTSKEIAKILSLSYRTIEDHIKNVKIKMNCRTKSELIEKGIEAGFLCYLPKIVFQ